MSQVAVPTAGDVRREIRRWRRGRAELNYWDAFSDAYIALFATVMVTAMATSVVLDLSRQADSSCTGACEQARLVGPWVCVLATSALALGVARLLGPVFSPPAANAWLLSAPVDRGALLRPTWWRTLAASGVGSAVLLVAPAALGDYSPAATVALVVAGSAGCVACVGLAGLAQVHEHAASRRLTWLLSGALWVVLAAAAARRLDVPPSIVTGTVVGVVAAVLVVLALVLAARAVRSLPRMSRRVLGQTEHLSASLSGALASLDLGLMYDVLLARRWGKQATVRSRTGGPLGWWALLHRDARRILRTPQPYVVLAGLVLLPYAAASAGAGRAVVLVTSLAGLVAGPALCTGLRVVVRSQGVTRMLPMSGIAVRSAHAVVPALALVAFAFATIGALPAELTANEAVVMALACGLSATAATVRWITARPADYGKPMVSTPMGAVPPGLIASAFRGVDVWAVTALPLAIGGWGVTVSLALSVGITTFLLSDGLS